MQFEIKWLETPINELDSEELLTRCRIGLEHAGVQMFRYEDLLGERQVRDAIVASAYPLSLWFAANWWRLRWESTPASEKVTSLHDWKMSHVLGAAGGGYAWPNLTFASDGERIQMGLRPSQEERGPLRYIGRLETAVSAAEFESCVEQLIHTTLDQLGSQAQGSVLQQLWQTTCEERNTPEIALQRMLEARLGYDPEEAPSAMMATLARLLEIHGKEAIQELACLGHRSIESTLKAIEQSLGVSQDVITLPLRNMQRARELIISDEELSEPWTKGVRAASLAREQLAIDAGPLSNRRLAELLEAPVQLLADNQTSDSLPIGIGEVCDGGRAKVALGKKRKESRRFMTARLVADGIYECQAGGWLPCTNASTARQKFQRAFAQEFLCPYQNLIEWMDTESPDEDLMEAAAEHFEVSPLLVNTVMVNRGDLPRSDLEAYQQW